MSYPTRPDNPYSAPSETIFRVPSDDEQLAGRLTRFAAAIIDGLIGILAYLPFALSTGYLQRAYAQQQPSLTETLGMSAVGFVVFFAIHGYFLSTAGQTLGKKILGIRIVDHASNQIVPLARVIGLRYLPLAIVQVIPLVNFLALIDVLFIFRADKRCLHDLIASTKVIKV